MRLALAAAILLVGCQEYNLKGQERGPDAPAPEIDVRPREIVFDMLASGEDQRQHVNVHNVGDGLLSIGDLRLEDGTGSFTLLTGWPFEVEPGESLEVEVAFTPLHADLNEALLVVVSDDPVTPEVPVPLIGFGAVPELLIEPADHTFTSSCPETLVVTLSNVGLDDLTIDGTSYDGTDALALMDPNEWPLTLPPATSTTLAIEFAPLEVGADYGTLTVESNDPRGPQTASQDADPLFSDVIDTFVVGDSPPVDVLFALDRSCSMGGDIRRLGDNFDQFITQVDAVTLDWQIGVVMRDHGCFEEGIITPSTPDYDRVFKDATSGGLFGFGGSDLTESLLNLSGVSLQDTAPGRCNEGFARPGALLHIIAVSDEPEQSGIDPADWIAFYQNYVTDPSLVVVSSVIDLHDSCGSLGTGYIEAAALSGGITLDICSSNWGTYAASLGEASGQVARRFPLSRTPDPATITITVDGMPMGPAWAYVEDANVVVFDVAPPAGATVEMTYTAVDC
ncbi:MAG: hypothetical protein ACI8PZ_005369 [Myxococcota bacterium]|jgi:hypothetical protein